MHLQTAHDILHQHEDSIGSQKALWYHEAAVGAVVERALEKLDTVCLIRVRLEAENEASERVYALTAHWISLVCHGRRADLVLLERLFDLPDRLQDAHVTRELGGARGNASNGAQD